MRCRDVALPTHNNHAGDGGMTEPHLELPERTVPPRAAILVLHGGKAESRAPVDPHQLTVRRMQPFARDLAALGDDLVVGQLRYRVRGWNGTGDDALADVAYALDAIDARFGAVPVVLVGHSMGGRAALRAAAHPSVRGVVALAPWLPGEEPVDAARRPRPRRAARHAGPHHQPECIGAVRGSCHTPRPPGRVPPRAVERARDAPPREHVAPPHRGVRRRRGRRRPVRWSTGTGAAGRTVASARPGRSRERPSARRRRRCRGRGADRGVRDAARVRRHALRVGAAPRRPRTHPRRAHCGGGLVPIDSGFIVHNLSTYPTLLRLFGELDVETQPTDMSMSVRCDGCGLEYAGAKGIGGIFARSANAADPRFLRMLVEVKRFHRAARRLLARDAEPRRADGSLVTLGDFLDEGRYRRYFRRHFMVPLVSCVWSCAPRTALLYPARSLFTFLDHHGALSVTGSPAWRTVVGGSRSYVERAAKELTATELSTPVRGVRRSRDRHRHPGRCRCRPFLRRRGGRDPRRRRARSPRRTDGARAGRARRVLVVGQRDGVAHRRIGPASAPAGAGVVELPARPLRVGGRRGARQLRHEPAPATRRARSSTWSPSIPATGSTATVCSPACATRTRCTPRRRSRRRASLPALSTDRLAFAGAYHGWGFHEDGCLSGVRAAAALGVEW